MAATSFEKMLSQYQGNLPNISDTNYTSELDYTLTEEVNKEVDNLKNDYAERTNQAIDLATRAAASKQDQLTDLAGLVKPAKELYDFWEAKKISNAKYLSHHTELKDQHEEERAFLNYKNEHVKPAYDKDVIVRGKYTGPEPGYKIGETYREWLNRNKGEGFVDGSEQQLRVSAVMKILQDKSLTEDGWLVELEDGKIGIGPKGIEYIEKNLRKKDEKYSEYRLQHDALITQHAKETFVFSPDSGLDIAQSVRLLAPSAAKLETLNASQAEVELVDSFDVLFPSLLAIPKQLPGMPKALSYMDVTGPNVPAEYVQFADMLLKDAYNDFYGLNKNYIEKIGDRRYKNKVFPQLYEKAQVYHKKFLNISLASAIEENKKRNSLAFSNRFRTDGIQSITGPDGFVSIFELQSDGTKDNPAGFIKVKDVIEYAVKNGDLKGRDLLDAINDEFDGRDGNPTTLQKLKPQFYNSLKEIALADIYEDIRLDEAETTGDILQQTAAIAKLAEDGNTPTDQIRSQAANTLQELIKKHNISSGHPALKELNYLVLNGQTQAQREGNAIVELEAQASRGDLLSSDLIYQLPLELQKKWLDLAKDLGLEGITSTELETIDSDIVQILKDISGNQTIDERLGPRFRLARTRGSSLFVATYNQLMRSDNRPDTLAAKKDNIDRAMHIVKEALETYGTEKEDKRIWGADDIPDYRMIVANDLAVSQYISKEGSKALSTKLYWNDQEEEAILNSIEAQKNGESISGWFLDKSKLFPNLTPKELFNQRLKATADLREGDVGDIKLEDKFEFRELVIKGNSAKTGQLIIGNPEIAEEILKGLKIDNADYNSTFRVDNRIPEFDPSQMTLREILQLRVDHYGIWNDDIGLGIYDQSVEEIIQILQVPGVLERLGGGDVLFDASVQDKLQLIKRELNANQASSLGSLDNTYRNIGFLTDEDENTWNQLLFNTGNERLAKDPFSNPRLMTKEVAKVALEDLIALNA